MLDRSPAEFLDITAGNILAKVLSFLANADAVGIVHGARVPIVPTSRADSIQFYLAKYAVGAICRRQTWAPACAAIARGRVASQ